MIVRSSDQGMVLSLEDQVPGGHVTLMRGKTTVFGVRLWESSELGARAVACIPLTPSHCRLQHQRCEARAHWKIEGRVVMFLMKVGSTLVQVMAVCRPERGQGNSCNQTVYGLDTLDLHLKS
ncbi:phospholipid-transporting ATPase [Trichonephila clavipes]|nr:phospholipid-transporting ATPase [Trichonephila clavipes]